MSIISNNKKNFKILTLLIVFFALLIIWSLKPGNCFNFCRSPETEPVSFYSPTKGIYVVDINTEKCPDCIEPYVSDSLETVESAAEKNNAVAAINAGFFDPVNALTTSYIIKNKELVADPALNSHLTNNPALKPYLPIIFNRSELRIIENKTSLEKSFEIVPHNDPSNINDIIHSIQAGPELVPELKLEQEDFIIKKDGKIVKQSAGVMRKYARSAAGIKGKHILLVAVSNEAPMTLKQLAKFMRKLGVSQAMAFDGGSSTSLYVNLPGYNKFVLTSAKDNKARRVKSILLVKKFHANLHNFSED